MPHTPSWRIAARHAPTVLNWDGDHVVYNSLSGDTHILDIDSGEVLDAIMAGTLAEDAIRKRLTDLLEVPDDDRLAAHVAAILSHLDQVGLIEQAD